MVGIAPVVGACSASDGWRCLLAWRTFLCLSCKNIHKSVSSEVLSVEFCINCHLLELNSAGFTQRGSACRIWINGYAWTIFMWAYRRAWGKQIRKETMPLSGSSKGEKKGDIIFLLELKKGGRTSKPCVTRPSVDVHSRRTWWNFGLLSLRLVFEPCPKADVKENGSPVPAYRKASLVRRPWLAPGFMVWPGKWRRTLDNCFTTSIRFVMICLLRKAASSCHISKPDEV